jgi:alpha-L-fucosidase
MPSSRSLSIFRAGTILVILSALALTHAQTAPTASQDPESIDQIWRKASSKYDSERATLLKEVDSMNRQGRFRADWESLQKYDVPEWYKDAKFGIFIHWGAYSVPAFGNEWYPRNMYVPGSPEYKHHLATYGPQDKFGYKDFIPMFKAEHFDPAAWAELFKRSGQSTSFRWWSTTMALPCTTAG